MENKKLQQMQQANTHLAPQQMSQPKQAPYHPTTGEYRPPHSPVFQSYPQYQSIQSNFAQINLTTYRQNEQSTSQPPNHKSPSPPKAYQQSPPSSHSSNTLQSPTSPQHQQMQEQKRMLKQQQQQQPQQAMQQSQNQNKSPPDQRQQQQQRDQPMVQSPSAPNSATQSFAASFQFVQFPLKHATQAPVDVTSYQGEQIYQTGNREKMYQASNRNHFHPNNTHSHPTPQSVPPPQQQYQKSDKTQIEPHKTKTEALLKQQQQQQSYALREHFNSPAAQQQQQSHYHSNQGDPNAAGFHHQNSSSGSQPQRNNVPPSSLNITNQYQPSDGTQPAQPQQQQPQQQPGDINYGNGQPQLNMTQQQQQPPIQQNPAFQQMVMHRHPPPPQQQQQQQQPPPPPPHQHPHQPPPSQPQQQTTTTTPQDWQNQIIIHQNHPNLVVNQACQTQLSGTANKLKSPSENSSSSQQTPTSASHPPLEKKKSSNQIQTLKSPITKRPQTAPITLSGWLYKQGSDGLKVWRKRWFVLSEYILYYYKAQEEEKLLGSILLPSYKVSACTPDDKIYRKFAFKCEHANMRTYWLAAENAELMGQWVRALTAATMMQGSSESDQVSQPSVSSLNHSGENSDSGIHTYQSQQSKLSVLGPLTPVSDSGGGSGGGPQPLYANAPPKPRRANDGGYSSPSPENSIDRYENNYDSFSRPHHDPSTPLGRRNDVKSPTLPPTNYGPSLREINSMQLIKTNEALLRMHQLRIENNKSPTATLRSQIRSPFQHEPTSPQPYPMSYSSEILDELYNANGDNIIRAPQSFNDDYSSQYYTEQQERELYLQHLLRQKQHLQQQQMKYVNQIAANNLNQMYSNAERRTPDTYGRSRAGYIQQMQQHQQQQHQQQQQQQQQAQQQFYDQYQGRHFSDYEDIYNLAQNANINQVGPGCAELGAYRRPMSPIGYDHRTGHIPNMPLRYTPNYLEPAAMQHVQMRARPAQAAIVPRPHSADFLEYEARNPENFHFQPEIVRAPRPKSSLDINRTPDSYYYSEESYAEKMRQSALYLQKHPTGKVSSSGNNYNNNYQISSPEIDDTPLTQNESNTMPRESDYERALRLGLTVDYPPTQVASVPRVHRPNNKGGYSYQNDQFLRSASARLPRKDEELNGRDGERKREESMKRLLEWKQRMLQSPLTRKGAPLTIPNTVVTKTPVQVEKDTLPVGLHRSRSETNANAGYNSYSSDDEASISVRNVRNIPKSNLTVVPDPSDRLTASKNELNNTLTSYYQNQHHHQSQNSNDNNANSNKFLKSGLSSNYNSNSNINLSNSNSHLDQMEHQHHQQQQQPQQQQQSRRESAADIYGMHMNKPMDNSFDSQPSPFSPSSQWMMMRSESQRDLDIFESERDLFRNLDVSAGDLLSRTHEELVLLLIQLRRQNSATARAIEQCCTDIHDIQNRIRKTDGPARMENIAKLDSVKQHLIDLEKQYEKSKPLVNLVDNMVKLGSLYRGGPEIINRQMHPESVTLDRLEFNQRIQERRLLQEERKHWDRLSPNHLELKTKVQQLYQLDQLLQQESGTLQSLQRDKEDIERALGGLRARLQNGNDPPIALEAARKQQHALEKELSRVHQLLAENSKKLEQTVAGNARLEQELLVLRQKLQASRMSRGSQSGLSNGSQSGAPDSIPYTGGTTAVLESELRRVQQLVGDMQRQRQELSLAVRQLTENSNNLYKQIKPNEYSSHIKKRSSSIGWTETDLDSMSTTKYSSNTSMSSDTNTGNLNQSTTPLYIDTGSANSSVSILNMSTSSRLSNENELGHLNKKYNHKHHDSDGIESSGMESENDLLEDSNFSNLSNQEKQEIKTVRIVKRESQQRQRDRERNITSVSNQNLDHMMEEHNPHHIQQMNDDYNNYTRSKSLPRTYLDQDLYLAENKMLQESLFNPRYNSSIPMRYSDYYSNLVNQYPVSMTDKQQIITSTQIHEPNQPKYSQVNKAHKSNHHTINHHNNSISYQEYSGLKNKTESIQSLTKVVGELSPVFQSEAAKQIIIEMSGNTSEENSEKVPVAAKHRRAVPIEKRRHYTAPHNSIPKALQSAKQENDLNRNTANWRARDDLDMEVALRPRINAPDVVRSAIGPREKISENTIDKLLAAPSKILIPERYIPEQAPELSPEEKKRRQEKVEVIKKMLSEAPINTSNDQPSLPPSQISAEKKQREHLLQLNQLLAQQVMQMSKMVAEKAMATLPSKVNEMTTHGSDDDHSPVTELPIYQQRENYFS